VYAAYDRLLRAYNGVDFDDLILLPVKLFSEEPKVLEKWQNRIRYMLVDEYQDTNTVQYKLVKQLAGIRHALTVVGDDDQSIYSWRGARPENLADLSTDFPTLRVIKLEQNYRSTGIILNAANAVISNNPHVFEKKLWSELGYGEAIRIVECKNEDMEAEKIASDILNHRVRNSTEFSDYAVLYRGNFQSRLIEMKFQAMQIPYKVSGGTSFFSRAEIKDIMAYLRLVINPDDDNAFLRIVNVPRREIGSSTLEKLGEYSIQRSISLYAAAHELGLEQFLDTRSLDRLRRFTHWLDGVTYNAVENDPVKAIQELINDIDYEAWLHEQNSNGKAAERKMQNVWSLVDSIKNMISKAEEEGEEPDLKAVINKLVLLDILDQQEKEDNSDRVQLMTLHAAKGLEYPHVFLIGINEEVLPHATSIEEDTVEEERRLFYVGITRARRTLSMTLVQERRQYGEKMDCTPSRFLDELPQEDLRWEGRGEAVPQEEKDAVAHAHLSSIRDLLGD
ncbi:MAG: UvrD-helicase domain-containing protein, partial [Gammaproteobacteria bacterium]|nr:UvrD-helicase domain-containing protein [Gammaproteobacteria bacterium]